MAGASSGPGFAEKDFQASSLLLHYAEGPPNGPPLLLLHGMARDWHSFSALLPGLASRFQIYALDLRGHGGSGRVPRGYRITEFADDISEFIQAVTPSGAALFGHSLGAMVGMCAAARSDSRITALVVGDSMISPKSLTESLYGPLFSQLHAITIRGKSLEELACDIGKIQITFPALNQPVPLEELAGNNQAGLLEWARTVQLTDPDALAMSLDHSAFVGWDPERLLPRISCPVLLLQANPELDGLLSDRDVKRAMQLLSRAEHVTFPLLGHALFMQQPTPVLKAVNAFLEKHSRLRP